MTNDPTLCRRALSAHYALQRHLYLETRQEIAGGACFAARTIADPAWNHAVLATAGPWLDAALEAAGAFFAGRGQAATVAVAPWDAELEAALRRRRWSPSYRHAWLFVPAEAAGAQGAGPPFELTPVRSDEEMATFVAIFDEVFGTGPQAGYGAALERSWRRTAEDVEVVHLLARAGGEPAGVASALHGRAGAARGVSGLYNLAVRRAFRHRGLGRALTDRRIADARARGQDLVFLQTEERVVERWQRQHGLVFAFATLGLTAPPSP